MVDTTQTTTEKKLTQSDIRGVFLRSNLFQGSWNFERMQALGFCIRSKFHEPWKTYAGTGFLLLYGTGNSSPLP